MRTLYMMLLLILFSLSAYAGNKGNVIPDHGKVIVLITSVECGFCIKNIGFYNQLSKQYKEAIPFIALYENSHKKIYNLPHLFPGREVELQDWKVIPSARKIYKKLIEYETFPQLLFVENGVVVNRFVGTIDSVKNEIRTNLPLFVY